MLTVLYLGIDPGVTGAYAVVDDGQYVTVADLPTISNRTLTWIDGAQLMPQLTEIRNGRPMTCVVERQGPRPVQGVSAAFITGVAFGSLMAICQVMLLPIELVSPTAWKASYGLAAKEKMAGKCASRDRARLHFPTAPLDRVKDHNRAEALLIARYAWRKQQAPII